MNIMEWARNEVEIACKRERGAAEKEGEDSWDYGCACYESALEALEALSGKGHTGMSIGFTKSILNRLIDWKPLTPIEDTDDEWEENDFGDAPNKNYQNKRMSSLFKTVYPDGTVEYRDVDKCYCVNMDNPNSSYHSGLVNRIIHEMFPIKFPYSPGRPIKVVCDDILTDSKNGDFDTVAVYYAVVPNDDMETVTKISINRFFKEPDENTPENELYHGWKEITHEEYDERCLIHSERIAKLVAEENEGEVFYK